MWGWGTTNADKLCKKGGLVNCWNLVTKRGGGESEPSYIWLTFLNSPLYPVVHCTSIHRTTLYCSTLKCNLTNCIKMHYSTVNLCYNIVLPLNVIKSAPPYNPHKIYQIFEEWNKASIRTIQRFHPMPNEDFVTIIKSQKIPMNMNSEHYHWVKGSLF